MAVNKVVYNRRTLIDLTADTVSKETLKRGDLHEPAYFKMSRLSWDTAS